MKRNLLMIIATFIAVQSFAQWQATNFVNVPYLPIGNLTSHKGDLYGVLVDQTPSKLLKLNAGGSSWSVVTTGSPGTRVIQDAGNKMYISTLSNAFVGLVYYSYDGGHTMILDTVGISPFQTGVALTLNMQYQSGKVLLGTNDAFYIKDTGATRWINITDMNGSALFPPSDPIAWSGDTMYGFKNNGNHGLWVSADYGTTWTLRSNNLPADLTSHRMIADHSSPRLYISGNWNNDTQSGIWYSDNGGGIWTQVATNLITTNTSNQPQNVTAMYADGQTFYAAMENNHNPSAADVIGTTTGLNALAWDTAGLSTIADNNTYGTMFIKHNGDFYLALDIIDVYKKGAATSGISAVGEETLNVYPNPVNDKLFINYDKGEEVKSVKVSSMDGRSLISQSYDKSGVDVSQLPRGIYILQLYAAGKTYTPIRFVKD